MKKSAGTSTGSTKKHASTAGSKSKSAKLEKESSKNSKSGKGNTTKKRSTQSKSSTTTGSKGKEATKQSESKQQTVSNLETLESNQSSSLANVDIGELPPEFDGLTPKQTMFVIFYTITRKGVEAARMAGYTGDYGALQSMATENLSKPVIVKALDAYMRPQFEKHAVTISRIVEHVADLAFAPWGEFIEVKMKNGQMVPIKMNLKVKTENLKLLAQMMRLVGKDDKGGDTIINLNQNTLNYNKYASPEEARKAFVDYLESRQ